MTFSDAKIEAKKTLKHNLGEAIVVSLLYSIILSALSSLLGIGGLLFGACLAIGYYSTLINASINQKFKIEEILSGFKGEYLSTRIVLSVVKNIYIFLWTLLFFIPGLIKSYSYMLSEFIALKNPEMSASECITESRRLMNGHKMNVFLLDLSFIGWHILCLLTLGLGYLILNPYIYQTRIEYINANIMELKGYGYEGGDYSTYNN